MEIWSDGPEIIIEFLVENRSEKTVDIGRKTFYLNSQEVNSSLNNTGRLGPGESAPLFFSIRDSELKRNRIHKINDISVAFSIYYPEEERFFITEAVTAKTENPVDSPLVPAPGKEVYQDEYLKVTAFSEIREFPGAYSCALYLECPEHQESSEHQESLGVVVSCRITAINEEPVAEGNPPAWNADVTLFPGKSADKTRIVYEKYANEGWQLPPELIRSVTWEIHYVPFGRDGDTGTILRQELHDLGEFTVQVTGELNKK